MKSIDGGDGGVWSSVSMVIPGCITAPWVTVACRWHRSHCWHVPAHRSPEHLRSQAQDSCHNPTANIIKTHSPFKTTQSLRLTKTTAVSCLTLSNRKAYGHNKLTVYEDDCICLVAACSCRFFWTKCVYEVKSKLICMRKHQYLVMTAQHVILFYDDELRNLIFFDLVCVSDCKKDSILQEYLT